MTSSSQQAAGSSADAQSTTATIVSSGYLLRLPPGPGGDINDFLAEHTRTGTQLPSSHVTTYDDDSALPQPGMYETDMDALPAAWLGSGPAIPVRRVSNGTIVPAEEQRPSPVTLDWKVVPSMVMILSAEVEAEMSEMRAHGQHPGCTLVIQGLGESGMSSKSRIKCSDDEVKRLGLHAVGDQPIFLGTDTAPSGKALSGADTGTALDQWTPYFETRDGSSGAQNGGSVSDEYLSRYVALFPAIGRDPKACQSARHPWPVSASRLDVAGRPLSLEGSGLTVVPAHFEAICKTLRRAGTR